MKMEKKLLKKRLLSLLLVFTMLFSSISVSAAPEYSVKGTTDVNGSEIFELGADEQAAEPAELPQEVVLDEASLESSFSPEAEEEEQRISEVIAEELPQEDEIVNFIVVLKKEPLLSLFSAEDIKDNTDEVANYREEQEEQIWQLEKALKEVFGEEEGFRLGFSYTASTTGVSVKTKFGNKEIIEQMEGVEKVYISPSFQIATEDLKGYTNNASSMIGATQLNETGYTGKGMKIAILDTGIVVNHPSFQALPEDKLTEDSMTKEEVKEIWDTLNAGKSPLRNASYHNSKLPFIFNYDGMNYDVSHATADHDHGTHVAGIAAANKIDSTNVVGIAPDAQLIVMQVFNQTGGAEWSTILAALEDCVKLDVDTVNLSLGAAAGFTDSDLEMAATLSKFEKTDIQVIIAGGNDTNNAYMNLTGRDMSKTSEPDNGLIGTPATSSAALAVASAENDGADLLYFEVDGRKIGFSDSAVSEATNFFYNYRNETLEFVSIGGLGDAGDYAGVDVEGKVAVVSRGTISFQEKQQAASDAGAIALVVYNNVPGSFSMAISDGTGHIPCVAISKTDGEVLKNLSKGSLKVCNGELIHVNVDRAMSSFSSWGVTPDLKLKPEITGVGGNIYSTRDQGLSGSNYGNMSGTSMASPQVAGAITVLTQYLRANHKDVYQSEQELRQLAANLLMSTAAQIVETDVEYSPRLQGAGLVNLTDAVSSGAYLTNPDVKENRPKGEMGDNDSKSGVFTFPFEIYNITGETKQYTFDSSVLTADVKDGYMSNTDRSLQSKVVVTANGTEQTQVSVPANGSVRLEAKITLTEEDKKFIDTHFENGNYVEGYLYVNSASEDGVDLSMPFLGFYGDWSDSPIFDEEGADASLYSPILYTYKNKLGNNPYFQGGRAGDEYNAISYVNPLSELVFGMMRNSKKVVSTVKDKATGAEYFSMSEDYIVKTYFNASYGMIIPYTVYNYNDVVLVWDGTNYGAQLPDNTRVTYTFDAYLDDGDDVADDSYSFDVTIDNQKPEVKNAENISADIQKNKVQGTVKLPLTIKENHYVAAVIFENLEGTILGKYEIENQPGVPITEEFDITGFGTDFTITVADYACNETEIDVTIDLSDMPESYLEPKELEQGRIYGNETYSQGIVSMGWFSGDKETFKDLRNETFDNQSVTYSGEYINGYVIAQRASDGALLYLTPYNTYWNTKVIWKQAGNVGDEGFKVFYDMALDYSSDKLYAIGWHYGGDSDANGKDDGHNALFEIVFAKDGTITAEERGPVSGLNPGVEGLTLGCTTEGQLYTISAEGNLYSLSKTGETTFIGTTDFVNESNYSGVNVIQSMGYDHNEGKMYWFAHSQVAHADTYRNAGAIYEVDLKDASCKKITDSDSSGYTSLFVPTDKTSDIFTPNVNPEDFYLSPAEISLVQDQTVRINVAWQPWNAVPGKVSWESKNESVAVVNQNGIVRAVGKGSAEIVATAQLEVNGSTHTMKRTMVVNVIEGADALYGFVITDYRNSGNNQSWITYSASDPEQVTNIGGGPLWQGGAYYNGNVYTVLAETWEEDQVIYQGTSIYRSTVEKGATPADTKITDQTFIKRVEDVEVGNIAFDYSTGRMYGVDYTNGGLCLIDIETGDIDLMGTFTGDLGPAIMPAMCVTANGTIIGSDMYGNIYHVDPDTLACTKLGYIDQSTWFYAAMTYDHNTGNIYWNPCMESNQSDLYLIHIDEENISPETTEIVKVGGVSSDAGVEQTVMFTIPEVEPETKYLQVEDIEITQGDTMTAIIGGSMTLKTRTTPLRPSAVTKKWVSDNEDVVKVDHFGRVSFVGEGTANVTVTISNRGENVPGPFSDTITINVYPSAGEFVTFMAYDEEGSNYFDYWVNLKDYDVQHTDLENRMIGTYSLRTGEYYDGYLYAYNNLGKMYRINRDNYSDYVTLGTHGLGEQDQVVSMAFDYTTGTMYALTLHIGGKPGYLATVDLTNGKVTKLHQLDECVSALAADEYGTLYGVGSAGPYEDASLFTIYKESGKCTFVQSMPGTYVYTGDNYMSEVMYNSQMTYDYGTKRLYLNATNKFKGYNSKNYGFYMIQLEGEEEKEVSFIANLGKPSLQIRNGAKEGQMFLGLLCAIPENGEVNAQKVSGIVLNKSAARVKKGATTQLAAQISPNGIEHQGVQWHSEDEAIATVDANGVVTGKATGTVVITATSVDNSKISASCKVTVIDNSKETTASLAYTISAKQEALLSFDPELPADTVEKITTMSGGKRIIGVAVKNENYLYYAVDTAVFPELYRYDMTTKQSTFVGELYVFIGGASDMAYDPVNKLIYFVSGFYIFQFNEEELAPGLNGFSGNLDTATMADMPLSELHAVACKDGDVYFLASDNGATLYRVDDNLKNLTKIRDVEVNTVEGECEMEYDARTERFYLTDAGDRLYYFEESGNDVTAIDMVGDGLDINGIAIRTIENPDYDDQEPEVEPKEDVTKVFSDVQKGEWYIPAIQYVYDRSIMSGNGEKFNPTGNVTRAQVVATLYKMEGSPKVNDYRACEELVDLEYGQWYTDAVCWAYNTGVATGNIDTKTFYMNQPVTRQQLAALFYEYAKYKGMDTSTTADISAMLNADKVSSYAETAVKWAVGEGVITGSEGKDAEGNVVYDLAPLATATRAQLAAMLQKFCEN